MKRCAVCGESGPDADRFCERCGSSLEEPQTADAAALPVCGCGAEAGSVDEDGYCLGCGRRLLPPASDHMEASHGADLAAVSDRGLHHQTNQDRFALGAAERGWALVVCDGVSSTRLAEQASATVAETMVQDLQAWLQDHARSEGAPGALRHAVAVARDALHGTSSGRGGTAPSTTVVAALGTGSEVTVAWLGDSRAYWIGDRGSVRRLTRDHSWAEQAVAAGQCTREQAQASPLAHTITRWLGADAEELPDPEIASFQLTERGWLLLCTDGLWNYAPEEDEMDAAVRKAQASAGTAALPLARSLVEFANGRGGCDNVTVAVLRIGPPVCAGPDEVATTVRLPGSWEDPGSPEATPTVNLSDRESVEQDQGTEAIHAGPVQGGDLSE